MEWTHCGEKKGQCPNHHRLIQILRRVETSGGEDNWEWNFEVEDERKAENRDESRGKQKDERLGGAVRKTLRRRSGRNKAESWHHS